MRCLQVCGSAGEWSSCSSSYIFVSSLLFLFFFPLVSDFSFNFLVVLYVSLFLFLLFLFFIFFSSCCCCCCLSLRILALKFHLFHFLRVSGPSPRRINTCEWSTSHHSGRASPPLPSFTLLLIFVSSLFTPFSSASSVTFTALCFLLTRCSTFYPVGTSC